MIWQPEVFQVCKSGYNQSLAKLTEILTSKRNIFMNWKRITIFLIILFVSNSYSQLGVGIGKGAFTRSSYWEIQIPNHILIYYQNKINDQLFLNLNSGYGITYTEDKRIDGNQTISSNKNTTKGFPIEISLLLKNDIFNNDFNSKFFLGLGVGFYHYTTEQKTKEETIKDYIKDSGFAQFISFGFESELFEDYNIFIEFKKLLFNNITSETKVTSSFPNPDYDKRTESYRDNGLYDIGICLGIVF